MPIAETAPRLLLQQVFRTRQQCVGDGWHLGLAGLVLDATLLMEKKSCKLALQLLNWQRSDNEILLSGSLDEIFLQKKITDQED